MSPGRTGSKGLTASSWLAARVGSAPDTLRAVVRQAVNRADNGPTDADTALPQSHAPRTSDATDYAAGPVSGLVTAAVSCIEEALRLGNERAAASPLLAADALLTWAVEASAEGGTSLDDLDADVTARLARLLGE